MSQDKKRGRRVVLTSARETPGTDVDFVSAVKVLGKQWVVVTVGVVLMIAAAVGIFFMVPPTYEVKASDVLLVPAQVGSSQAGQANPYLGFGGSLGIVAEITARRMNDKSTVEEMIAKGGTAEYLVDIVPGEAPMLQVTANSKDREAALRTAQVIEKSMTELLTQSQIDLKAPDNLLITTSPVTTPTHAEIQRGSQMRALAGMVVVGLALTVLIAFLRESVQARKRQKAAATAGQESEEDFDEAEAFETSTPSARAPIPPPVDPQSAPRPAPVPAAQAPGPVPAPETQPAPRVRPPMRRPRPAEETQRIKPVPNPDHVSWPRTELEVSARPAQRD
jgi:capsular polysaccharide biosynthesis protein